MARWDNAGAPNQYNDSYIDMVDDYITQCNDEYYEFHKTRWEKSDSYDRHIKVNLPTVEWFAIFVKRATSTINKWMTEQPKFSEAIDKIKRLQKKRLMEWGLNWDYNPTIAKLILSVNHWMNEKTEIESKVTSDVTVTLTWKETTAQLDEIRKKLLWE